MRAYRLADDGRPFHGFQRQPEVRTVGDETQTRESDFQARLHGLIMGSFATPPDLTDESSDDDASRPRLGDLRSVRFADVAVDSVEAVRDERSRE